LKALYFWNKRGGKDMEIALDLYKMAIQEDPAYALAYAGLANCLNTHAFWAFSSAKVTFAKSITLAKKALEIDNKLAEAYAALAFSSKFFDRNWKAAENLYKKAIELNPNYAYVHIWYATVLLIQNKFDKTIKESKRAMELDPLSITIQVLASELLRMAGRKEEASKIIHRVIEMAPDFGLAYYVAGKLYIEKKQYPEAISFLEKGFELGASMWTATCLLYVHGKLGQKEQAELLINKMEALSRERYVPLSDCRFFYHLNFGEKEKALEFLEKIYEERSIVLPFGNLEFYSDSFQSDPRFQAYLKKIGLP
jgi:tetratricopeptide (TPR) repeat protein